jgi:hypothetical protein
MVDAVKSAITHPRTNELGEPKAILREFMLQYAEDVEAVISLYIRVFELLEHRHSIDRARELLDFHTERIAEFKAERGDESP